MTGAPPVLDRPALWAALSHMQIDLPGGGSFESALADQQGWTTAFARRVTDEYRRFLYLAATAGFEVTPSENVDEAWHLHLASPHYEAGLCERILGRTLEHRPSTGGPGEEARHHRQYRDTLALYETAFGKSPPFDIWPRDPIANERPKRNRAVTLASRTATAAALAAAGAGFLGYPATALVLVSIALVLALPSLLVSAKAQSGAAGGCGGACGGGSPDTGCGSSCGGGCGGD